MRNPTTTRATASRATTSLALTLALVAGLGWTTAAYASGDASGIEQITLKPAHDTWTTHDDKSVHGAEPILKVGVVPQDCDPLDAKNYCTLKKPAQVCCPAKDGEKAFCAEKDTCDTAVPIWTSFRKFRTYIRFNLNSVPKGTVVKAELRLRVGTVIEKQGGPAKVVVTRLKQIGIPNAMCQWAETELNDTNGTTWSSLPQNIATANGQVWIFDVTKAAADWLTGNTDKSDGSIEENCGFHLYDPDFGNQDAVIERWVELSSKEGTQPPELVLTIAKDQDKDGATADVDCNDNDDTIHPGAIEVCDGIDNDCSGAADDEVCDGVDNDCDGSVDESDDGGVAPCPSGFVCANHTCVQSCKKACGGPYDKKCEWDDTEKRWTVYGCGLMDADPCYDWFAATQCNPGQFCEYGSCSSNCVDLCDTAGAMQCDKDALGRWHVSECGDWDSDSCLELKTVEDCKIAATCTEGVCNDDGCVDTCADVGTMMCLSASGTDGADQAKVCKDSNGDGCLDEAGVTDCPTGCQAPTGCVLPGSVPPATDAGSTDTGEADAGTADTSTDDTTAADAGSADGGDDLGDTEGSSSDATGGDDATSDAAVVPDDERDDAATVADAALVDAGGTGAGSFCGACPPGTTCQNGTCVARPAAKKTDSGGCRAGGGDGRDGRIWFVLLSAWAVLWLRRQRRQRRDGRAANAHA